MIAQIIPISNGKDLPPIDLLNCEVVDGVLHADSVCLGVNVDIDGYKIAMDGKTLVNDVRLFKPMCGNSNSKTWLNWPDLGICKV